MEGALKLVSHDLCPYVQRASIVLAEKGVAFEKIDIDLADKPAWFTKLSPLGKVPLLLLGGEVLFESAVIAEYLEETYPPALHPAAPLEKARHRAWMEFCSSILADIWILETSRDPAAFNEKVRLLHEKFARLEAVLSEGPYFAGARFCIVDAVFAPVFRYFDVFDTIRDLKVFDGLPKVAAWRKALAERPSVKQAAVPDYPARLAAFLKRKGGYMVSGART
jgi:glutathione S-transferase